MILILVKDIDLAENIREILLLSGLENVQIINLADEVGNIKSTDAELIIYADRNDPKAQRLSEFLDGHTIPVIVLANDADELTTTAHTSVVLELPFDNEELIHTCRHIVKGYQII